MKKLEGYEKGVNLGGWISQCEKELHHIETFITEKDIEQIASWKTDHVRLPVDYDMIQNEDESPDENGHRCIENCIKWCKKYGLNMILDLHKTDGYVFDNQKGSTFFESEKLQDKFYKIWDDLAERYSKYSDMMIFELLNEVVDPNVSDLWNEISGKCIDRIRNISKDIKIIVGGTEHNSITSVKKLAPPKDENIIYTFHCYEPLIFTHQSAYWIETMPLDLKLSYPAPLELYKEKSEKILGDRSGFLMDNRFGFDKIGTDFFEKLFKEAIEVANERNVVLYCGEYGVIDRANPHDALKWFKDINAVFKKYSIGRAAWTYKGKDFGISDPVFDDVRDEIIALL